VTEARRFPRGAIASPHYLASTAGLEILARGGNAVDAAVAASTTLGVVAPYLCGYGGDLFTIVWDGRQHGYLGSGRSPATTSIAGVRERTGGDEMPTLGPDAVTVPGAVAGWFDVLDRFGTRSFADVVAPALRYARDGFELTHVGGAVFTEYEGVFGDEYPDLLRAYRDATDGRMLRQPELARTIALLAADGPDVYYRGPIGAAIVETVQRAGGVLAADDLAAHRGTWVEPLRATYRDVEILELPPPTQGVTALETLRILDGFALPQDPVARAHLQVEAMKLGLADRDAFVTDPAHMPVPAEELLGDAWIADRRRRVDPRTALAPDPGIPQVGGTAYLCVADGDGLLVSMIQSNFMSFGSGVRDLQWGINLNNRGSSFSLDPDTVNALGPGKLPMHTLIPALGLRDGRPWLVFGTMGADAQAQVHVQVLGHMVDDGRDPQAAISAPRWRVEPQRWRVWVERRFPPEMSEGLRARGHEVLGARRHDPTMGHAHAIELTVGGYAVAADPRSEGAALGI
jgi:gamma-glutamyltranspeptidase / glutathione hydrolase